MTLSKQLLLLLSALFIIIFSVNFLLSVNNTRDYLVGEAEIHAQDTATSLGLSLSPYMVDESDPVIETMMKAIFDRGYYQEIKLINVDDKELVRLSQQTDIEGVPDWFIQLIPIETITAVSEISSGWNISGVVHVSLNSNYAYLKLYQQAKTSLIFSLTTLIISIVLLLLILHFTLSSLKKINNMALGLAEGKFAQIESIPWTTEVRNITLSMNTMSEKIESVINKLNQKLDNVGNKLQKDDLTGLKKKTAFETDMKQLFTAEDDTDAFIFLIKLDSLPTLVKELGNESIDRFIIEFSEKLTELTEQAAYGELSVYRLVGSEFVLLAKKITQQQAEQLAHTLSNTFDQLGENYPRKDISHIGIVPFNPFSNTDAILLAAREAYEQALLVGSNAYAIRMNDKPAKTVAEWKNLVFDVVDREAYNLAVIGNVDDIKTSDCMMQEAFIHILENSKALPVAVFVSIAEKYEKIVGLDKGVVLKVIDHIQQQQLNHAMAINLSTRTIKNNDFRSWLATLLKQNQSIAGQLVFSFSAYAVAKDVHVYQEFIQFIHALNSTVMIKRFETQSLSAALLKELKPDYVRLSRDLGQGVAFDNEKQDFIETIKGIGDILDIKVLAENIRQQEDIDCLKAIGIMGLSR